MAEQSALHIIARIHSDFPTKFGIPRQSGLVEELKATIVFEPEYRNPDALRGLEGFSHLWLIWQFSQAVRKDWSPTVRPPRLGGNTRMGVFATRSPFRPNPLGLSCVGLEGVELHTPQGPVIHVTGADLMDGSPIYDIKPYIPYADCRPQAVGGFASAPKEATLEVDIPPELLAQVPEELRAFFAYINDPSKRDGSWLTQAIDERVRKYNTTKWRKRQMTLEEMMNQRFDAGREEGIGIGREEGIGIGREEGEEKLNRLNMLLIRQDRMEDLKKAAEDKEYRRRLYREFGLDAETE